MAVKPLINESEILSRIARGDQHAFTILFQWYGRPLGEFVLKLTRSQEAAQEIVQDAFIKIWLKRQNLPEIQHFSNYLFIICRNQAFATLKKMAKDPTFAAEPQELERMNIAETEESSDYYP